MLDTTVNFQFGERNFDKCYLDQSFVLILPKYLHFILHNLKLLLEELLM